MPNVGLRVYRSPDFLLEASPDGSSNWRKLAATGYVETEEEPDQEELSAFGNRLSIQLGEDVPQTISIAMDTPQLSDPAFDWLALRRDAKQSIWIRASMPRGPVYYPVLAANTVALAVGGAATFAGRTLLTIKNDRNVVPGMAFIIDGDPYVLKDKGETDTDDLIIDALTDVSASVTGEKAAAVYRPTGISTAVSAETYLTRYPGWERLAYQAEILSFAALNISVDGRPQTVLNLRASSRFPQRLVYTI